MTKGYSKNQRRTESTRCLCHSVVVLTFKENGRIARSKRKVFCNLPTCPKR